MYNNPPQNYPAPNGGFQHQMPPNAMPGTMPMALPQFYMVNPQQQQTNGNNFAVPPNFNGAAPPPTMIHHHPSLPPNMVFSQTGVPMFTQPPPHQVNMHVRQAPFYQPMHQQAPQQQHFGQSSIPSQMPPPLQQQAPVQLAGGGRPQIPAQYYTNPSIMSRQPPMSHQGQYVAAPMSHLVRSQSQQQFSPPVYDPSYQQHAQMDTRSVSSYPNATAMEFIPQHHVQMDEEQYRNMQLSGHEEQMLRDQHQQQSQSVSTGVSEEPMMFNHQDRHQSQQSESEFSAINEDANNKQLQQQQQHQPMQNTFEDQQKMQFVAAELETRLAVTEELLQVPEVSSNAITPDNPIPLFQDSKQTPSRNQPVAADAGESWRNSSTKLQKIHEENGQQAAVGVEVENRVQSHLRDGPKICYYCKTSGEAQEVYNSHHTTDRLDAIVCPKLLTQKGCSRCAAAGGQPDDSQSAHLELDCTFNGASAQTEDFHHFAIKFSERIGHHHRNSGGGIITTRTITLVAPTNRTTPAATAPPTASKLGGGNKRGGGGYDHQHNNRAGGPGQQQQQKYNSNG
uniref:Nanos-type domain-containing protein n=1 Tax=Ditylenchus dipsaci TaxID=166011 RepID=A0A915DU78_9BILA